MRLSRFVLMFVLLAAVGCISYGQGTWYGWQG